MLLQILVAVSVLHHVQSQCSFTSWQYSFNDQGQSKCNEIYDYIHALYRFDKIFDDDNLSLLDGAQCCQFGDPWRNVDQQVVYEDWTYDLDYDNSWAFCRVGYFLQGFYRSPYEGYLNHLEAARCTKPANHPLDYGSCIDVDTTACMSQKGFCYCPEGHWLTGIYRADGYNLYFLKKIKCCTPAAKPLDMDEKSKIQTRIMDTTLWNMANLAHNLGYGWCYGCRGMAVGEDFIRNGNTWKAATTPFWNSRCDGDKNWERLNLVFDNWGFGVKEIVYGKTVIDNLQPETVDSGVIYNNADSSVTESIERSKTIQDTITHTTTSTFTNSHELGISLDFDFEIVSAGTSYTFKYESSTTTTNEQSISKIAGFTKTSTITLEPKKAAKYRVILSKSRTTIPYTAVVTTKFSTEMKGFLRWEDGDGNFHQIYRTSKDRPTFNYRFGDASVPFYEALKKQSDRNEGPWMWGMLFQKFPNARHAINRLTDESQYQFTLTGKLEKVEGTYINVEWEKIPLNRRDVPRDEAPVSNITTYIAKSGPADKPAIVEYPKVELKNNEPFEPIQIPVRDVQV